MSTRSRDALVLSLTICACALVALAGCERERRAFAPAHDAVASDDPYEGNAYGISQGMQAYQRFNCVGCHANGGGGMGPPLTDAEWRYGADAHDVFTSIHDGRPNGMPAFGGRIPEDQIWQLVAYVRSMPGYVRADVASGRTDHMRVKESEQERYDEPPPRPERTPPPVRTPAPTGTP
jgi:cytochrome c oxidase cbb3-type subunit 3